ncbi:MAG: hypothetical protein R3F11_20145 [Verrucomicrobiales bacterium]
MTINRPALLFAAAAAAALIAASAPAQEPVKIPALPHGAKLAFEENWSSGTIDPAKWYRLKKQWGAGNHGVVPDNVFLAEDEVAGKKQNVLVCRAHGDRYEGPVKGQWGKPQRVGGVIVSKPFFASGRFEVAMKIGDRDAAPGGPANPAHPQGTVPAIWTYGYRLVKVAEDQSGGFIKEEPLYHPYIQQWGKGLAFYWSELDFPEFGKEGAFDKAMFNTFLNKQHDSQMLDVRGAADGGYHTYTTEWRTHLVPIKGVTDAQVAESGGFWWVQDKAVDYASYWAQPLKRIGEDDYAVYAGKSARHWIDGKYVGENTKFVPAMAAQLNLGIWLPEWAGSRHWVESKVSFASIKVWQFNDPGDVRGVLTEDIEDNF